MSATEKTDSVWFTTKGQVVIPSWLRDQLDKAASADRPLEMSDVNYAEVKYMLIKKDGNAAWEQAAKVLEGLPIQIHSTSRPLADTAADFKARFKISLADAFAAALTK